MATSVDIAVVGAGVFGVTAAVTLRRRGHRVALLDPGPLPHPRAASTDISKVVRMAYGADEAYTALAERAREGWLRWNRELGEQVYHEVGVAMLTRQPMRPGEFERDSLDVLVRRGHRPERLSADDIPRRFPAFAPGAFTDGFFHDQAGFADSGRAVSALIRRARASGVEVYENRTVEALVTDASRVVGVRTRRGERFDAGRVVVATGAWTPALVPDLAGVMRVTGHPVFHLAPRPGRGTGGGIGGGSGGGAQEAVLARLSPPALPVFTADIGHTGWYGFPLHPREGVIKLGNHGVGVALDPDRDERAVTTADVAGLRAALAWAMPSLAEAPVVHARRCLYCDTLDGHFWIDRHPDRDGLVIATGGSGHGFKFAPVLGDVIADAVEGAPNPMLPRFAWRALATDAAGEEAARFRG